MVLLVLPAAVFAQVACGDLVSRGDKVVLTADLGPCDGDAALVLDGGSVDLGGHTLACGDLDANGRAPVGVRLVGKKSRLKNGTVVGCSTGVDLLPGADRAVLVDVTVRLNDDDGVRIGSDRNRLVRTVATDNGDDGIELRESADRNKVVGARAERNGDAGIVAGGTVNKLAQPSAVANGTIGIDLDGTGNKVAGGNATSNGAYDLANCAGNKVRRLSFGTATPDCGRGAPAPARGP